jgi:hypothetical protein
MEVIGSNQQMKASSKSEIYKEEIYKKTPVFICSCGVKILIVPDLAEMNKAIENHLVEHRKLRGQILARDTLTQQILNFIVKILNET